MKTPPRSPTLAIVRCAIYTRKSTEEGLEQEFNSLDAQRESGQAYIQSQQHEGWVCLPDRYDDGGFTGGNTERPALQRLLADIADGKVDCVVIYKIDRLSRSLLDFAKMMDLFDRQRVALVSVTQQFNSATSMGRLVLNVLLSFAQFEREIIAERTRDKIAATRRKGKWTGGYPLLGYDVDPRGGRLPVNEDEAVRVRAIFRACAPQTAHILRGWLIASRGGPYDSPGTSAFMEENHGLIFPRFSRPAARPVDPQTLQQVEGPTAGAPPLTPAARHHRDRPLRRHCRCPGLARDRDLRPQAPRLAQALPPATQRHPFA